LGMGRMRPECPDPDPSDRSVAADALLRQEPDEEEDEEEDEGDGKEDDDDDDKDDDGYSERACPCICRPLGTWAARQPSSLETTCFGDRRRGRNGGKEPIKLGCARYAAANRALEPP